MAYNAGQTPMSILVVENDPSLRDTLRELLELKGLQVETAPDGLDALSKMKNLHFDMVLTDLHMPRLNGLELLESITGRNPRVTCVLMSSQLSRDIKSYARQIGVYANLDKPFLTEKLFSIIEHSMRDAHQHPPDQRCRPAAQKANGSI